MFHVVTVRPCRIIMKGSSYTGYMAYSNSFKKCLPWSHPKVSELLRQTARNLHFPDASMKSAKNHCRNPTGKPFGPWCYTAVDGSWEYCNVPFCSKYAF